MECPRNSQGAYLSEEGREDPRYLKRNARTLIAPSSRVADITIPLCCSSDALDAPDADEATPRPGLSTPASTAADTPLMHLPPSKSMWSASTATDSAGHFGIACLGSNKFAATQTSTHAHQDENAPLGGARVSQRDGDGDWKGRRKSTTGAPVLRLDAGGDPLRCSRRDSNPDPTEDHQGARSPLASLESQAEQPRRAAFPMSSSDRHPSVGLLSRLSHCWHWPQLVTVWAQDSFRRVAEEQTLLPAWIFKLCASVVGWYTSSILLTLFNKLIWSKIPEARHNTATIISLQSAVMSGVILLLWLTNRIDLTFATRRNVCLAFLPIAALASIDIAATNASYSYVSVSAVVVVKSAIPFLTYLLGVLFGLVFFSLRKIACLVWIAVTVSLTVTEMNIEEAAYFGIVLALTSVTAAALRWTLTHILLKGSAGSRARQWADLKAQKLEPFQLVAIQQPLILITSVTFALLHDNAANLANGVSQTGAAGALAGAPEVGGEQQWLVTLIWWIALYAILSSALAFTVVASEMYIIKYTDSTALTVCGVGKEVLVLVSSHLIFADKVNIWSALSIALTLLGLLCYAYLDRTIKHPPNEAEILAHYDDYPTGEVHNESQELCLDGEGSDVAVVVLDSLEDYIHNENTGPHFHLDQWPTDSSPALPRPGSVPPSAKRVVDHHDHFEDAASPEFFSVSRLPGGGRPDEEGDYYAYDDAGEAIPSHRRMMPSSPMLLTAATTTTSMSPVVPPAQPTQYYHLSDETAPPTQPPIGLGPPRRRSSSRSGRADVPLEPPGGSPDVALVELQGLQGLSSDRP